MTAPVFAKPRVTETEKFLLEERILWPALKAGGCRGQFRVGCNPGQFGSKDL